MFVLDAPTQTENNQPHLASQLPSSCVNSCGSCYRYSTNSLARLNLPRKSGKREREREREKEKKKERERDREREREREKR
jgi:ribosome-binding protein aMBF1 (putative translation factor)